MAYYDVTFFYSSADNEGWSETYTYNGSDIAVVETDAIALMNARLDMVVAQSACDSIRISNIAVHGDAYAVTGITFPAAGNYTDSVLGELEINTALKVRLIGTPPNRNLKYFRGLDLSVVTGRHFLAPSTFMDKFNTWAGLITAPSKWVITYTNSTGIVTREAITDTYIAGVSARKPGRPFGSPRGRKFAHRTHSALASAARGSIGSAPATEPKPASRSARTR
jgi:hypothetical protein